MPSSPPRPQPLPPPLHAAPASADEAKQAWLDAARRAETYNEQVLAAEAAVTAATGRSCHRRRRSHRRRRPHRCRAAEGRRHADAVVAEYQTQGRRLRQRQLPRRPAQRSVRAADRGVAGGLPGPGDVASQVATDQQDTLSGALAARKVADDARARRAGQPRTRHEQAKQAADQATADAEAARAALDTGKAQLDAEIATYQLAFAQLSAADITAAVAGAEAANMDAASQARQAEQAAQRDRAGLASDAAPLDTGAEFSAWAAQHAPNVQAGIAVAAALSRQGLPYVWAAEGPDSFDCSSLMMWAWAQAGVTIPRNSAAQAGPARGSARPAADRRPGHLLFPGHHVGMYVGDGKVLHASMPGVPIKVGPLAAAGPNPTGHRVNAKPVAT